MDCRNPVGGRKRKLAKSLFQKESLMSGQTHLLPTAVDERIYPKILPDRIPPAQLLRTRMEVLPEQTEKSGPRVTLCTWCEEPKIANVMSVFCLVSPNMGSAQRATRNAGFPSQKSSCGDSRNERPSVKVLWVRLSDRRMQAEAEFPRRSERVCRASEAQ